MCVCLSCLVQVYAMPTLLFIKDGKIQQRAEGAMLAPKIKDLTEHIFFQGRTPLPAPCAVDALARCCCGWHCLAVASGVARALPR